MRPPATLLALALAFVLGRPSYTQADSIPADRVCSSSDSIFVAQCFTVHARLVPGADNILVRIWPVGTTRILGYADGALKCSLPPKIDSLMTAEQVVFADVVVRPVTRSRPGYMRFVCIATATRLVVRPIRRRAG